MSASKTHVGDQPTVRKVVLVSKLSGGPHFRGSLVKLGRTGAGLILDRPLERGEVIRLAFPKRLEEVRHPSQTIIGLVQHHSHSKRGRHVIRVVFGWDTQIRQKRFPGSLTRRCWSWLRGCLNWASSLQKRSKYR